MWRAHEKRRLEAVLGKDEAEAYLSQALPFYSRRAYSK
jgi:hypothetical protein